MKKRANRRKKSVPEPPRKKSRLHRVRQLLSEHPVACRLCGVLLGLLPLGWWGLPAIWQQNCVVPALIRELHDSQPEVRARAALDLSRIGPAAREAQPVLQKLLSDDDDRVRMFATIALSEIRTKPVLTAQ